MYLRTTQRRNKDGSTVRYVQLAHNRRVEGVTQAEVLVSPGQQVRKGDPIAHAGRGGWTHASTSGLVEAVASHPISHPSGRDGPCIVIEPDGRTSQRPAASPCRRTNSTTLTESCVGSVFGIATTHV